MLKHNRETKRIDQVMLIDRALQYLVIDRALEYLLIDRIGMIVTKWTN